MARCGGSWPGWAQYAPGHRAAPVGHRVDACGTTGVGPELVRRSPKSHPRPLTARECATLDRIGRDMTHKDIAAELGISINTVGNLAANAYKKLGAHGPAAAVLAHRDAHSWCGSRIDFGPILERIKASRTV